jgi:phosphatidylserine/phosphatidylglycerophosphate/cardiolipin synthase-like enzyme/uncharacterized membrane protein YdjX (TVP38/TMEM64 family)
MENARRSIFILGWDLDSRTVLRPEATVPEEMRLLPFLCACLERQPTLQIFVLMWDFSLIYAFEREPQPRQQFGQAHARLHFNLDAHHGTGGSHHQKIVVIDDVVAFVGGVDLTSHRWDTPEHKIVDPRRVDVDGNLYDPFHEVHTAIAGPAAYALGQWARMRWQNANRSPSTLDAHKMPQAQKLGPSSLLPWPQNLVPDATHISVGISRTWISPPQPAIREIEALTLAAIHAAEHWIYAENQYLTSGAIVRALAQRLSFANSPEVVLILPINEFGWMEQSSMGLLRAEALSQLKRADLHGKLRLLSPIVVKGSEKRHVAIHAKVLVVDNHLAKVGSANFTNRSMGLDSECDLAVEADGTASAAFVASVRDRLLAEHMGLSAIVISNQLAAHGSICKMVDAHPASAPRALIPTPFDCNPPLDLTAFDGALVDPPEPWNMDLLLERAVPISFRRRLAHRWRRPLGFVAVVFAIFLMLHYWDPQAQNLQSMLESLGTRLTEYPAGVLLLVFAYAILGIIFIPVTMLATATFGILGMWPGIAIAWLGGVLSALVSHTLGGKFGPKVLAWLPKRLNATFRQLLTRRPFWSVVILRLIPVGNFAMSNLIAGAVNVPRRSFLLGNMVGLLPGLLGLGILIDRILASIRQPSTINILVMILVLALALGLSLSLKRRFSPTSRSQ